MAERGDLLDDPRSQLDPAVVEGDRDSHAPVTVPGHARPRALAGARPAAARRCRAREREGRLRPPDLVDVGGRPRRRPARGALPLRLRRAEEPGERPADLLEGTRLAARLRALPRRGRALGGGVPHLPAAGLAPRGPSDAGAALGRRRDRLARARAPDRRRAGARRQAPRPPAVSRLGDLRRQRDGRGLDVGGDRARGVLRARQPDRDHRRQPARPARRDDARLGPLVVLRPAARVRLARDRDRRARRRADRRRVPRGGGDDRRSRPPIVAKTVKGKGYSKVEDTNGWHGKAVAEEAVQELGGIRNVTRRRAASPRRRERHRFEPTAVEWPRYELGSKVATRKAYGEALAALGGERARRGRARRRGLELDLLGDLPRRASRAVLRDVHRRAADGRRGRRHAGDRLEAVRVDVRRVHEPGVRLRPDGGDLARER